MEESQKRVRVSIANLAWYVKMLENDVQYPFAILNPKKLKQGERQYMALGGGAMLTERGKEVLEQAFDASDFEQDPDTGFFDARFRVERQHLEAVLKRFELLSGTTNSFEHDPTLDIIAEISGKEFLGYDRILDDDEVKLIKPTFVKVVRQKSPDVGTDTSARASAETRTHRLFRIYELVMPVTLYQRKIWRSPVVRILSDNELETTDGGSRAGKTKDGFVIQNNLFIA